MVYDKKVKYLDYCENGERVRGSGFAKCEVRNGSFKIEITVTGMSYENDVTKDVILLFGDREVVVGRIGIAEGRGQYFYLCQDAGNIADTGIGYSELSGLRIPLGTGREISCRWQPQKAEAGQEAASSDAENRQLERTTFKWADLEQPERTTYKRADPEQLEKKRIVLQGGKSMQEEKEIKGEIKRESTVRQSQAEGTMSEGMTGGAGRGINAGTSESVRAGLRADAAREAAGMDIGREEKNRGDVEREDTVRGKDVGGGAAKGNIVREDTARANAGKGEEAGEIADREHFTGGEAEGENFGREPSAGRSIVRERSVHGGAMGEKGKSEGRSERKPVVQKENKWDQLWAIYPHIRPFRDEREYLSIGPADFVLFPSASYYMVNNSFLLHGYYNYHHLILVKAEKRGESYYYIGVPGNYYEREKQVAIMFGFESFECAEEPAQAGDFGYYMMRTEL